MCFNQLKWIRFLAGVAWWGHWCLCRKWVETSCIKPWSQLGPPKWFELALCTNLHAQLQGSKEEVSTEKKKLDLEIRTFFCLAQVDVLFSVSNYLRCVSPALLPDIKKVPWGLSCVKLGCSKVHRASRLKAGEIGRRPSHLLRWKWLQKWWMVSFQLACLFSLALKCDSFFFMNIPWRWWEMPRFERKVNWLEFAFFLTFFGAFSAQFLPVFSQIYALQPLML